MADKKLESVEKRIETLESRVFADADKDAAYPKDSPQIVDNLSALNSRLHTAVTGRRKVEDVMKRLNELEQYLDPAYTERLTLSNQARTEIILAEESLLRQHVENLEKVKNMCDVLGSEHLKVVPSLQDKLQDLSKVHLQQQDQTAELTDETKQILTQYNQAITMLSKQFASWDQILTRLEIASKPPQQLD